MKEAVFPFAKFPGVDIVLGPEMRSTGEVMGIDHRLRRRVRQEPARGQQPAAGFRRTVFVSVAARDRNAVVPIAGEAGRNGLHADRAPAARPLALAEHGITSSPSGRSTRAARTCSTTWPTARSR